MIPLLLAATPIAVGSPLPLQQPGIAATPLAENFGQQATVQTFDPVARAAQLAQQLPRQWSGTYQGFEMGSPVTVQLQLASATALGQMVDVRGAITIGSSTIPVQGNLNAKSDQLDLLLLGDAPGAMLENGGAFLSLQGFTLAGWNAPRLTHPGGVLVLTPVGASAPAGGSVRGLW